MSKAFTKEETSDALDDEPEGVPALPKGLPNYMTPEGYHRLLAERQRLVEVERPEVVQVVSWAASNGDRSENGDYLYGKKRLREIDRRLRFLTKRLECAEVVEYQTHAENKKIFFGATVVYINPEGEEQIVQLVGVDEADPLKGKISWIAPVARAFLKQMEGDTVYLNTPSGTVELEVVEVHYRGLPE